jgi:hypothetical protein
MLGWRHDTGGICQAWVRVEFAGVSEDAWVDLTLLRLPEARAERHLRLAPEPRSVPSGSHVDTRGGAASEITQTQHLPLVRETAAPPTGRRVPPTGGRRRAPETGELPAVGAPPVAVERSGGRPLGRHRAPAGKGRHRAADTGLLGVVPDPTPQSPSADASTEGCASPPLRSELPPAGPVVRPQERRADADLDLLTRPMRLEDGVGSVRRPRRGSLSGV